MILLLTRPHPQGERFAREFTARFGPAIPVIQSPVLGIVPRGGRLDVTGVSGLIFTSANAVACFAPLCSDRRPFAYCVGARTASAARRIGLPVAATASDADAIVARILKIGPEGRMLHLRGEHTRGNVAARLTSAGQLCETQVLYDQVSQGLNRPALDALSADGAVLLPLFSPRTASIVSEATGDAKAPLLLATMSPAVTLAWRGPAPQALCEAATPDANAMLDALKKLMDANL